MAFDVWPVSAALAARGVSLRRQDSDDQPFLQALFTQGRWDTLEPTGWPDDAKLAFLQHQFLMQSRHYATHYADALFAIIEQGSQPVGRLYLHVGARDLRIVDISLITAQRGTGLGTALLQSVLAQAEGRTVSLHVDPTNPARRLYHRLGFVERGERGADLLMEWQPV